MLIRKLTNIVFIALLSPVLLQGCAQMPDRSAGIVDSMTLNNAQKDPELGNLSQGDLVELYSGLLAPFGKVMIGREYYSASGRLCKQILNVTGNEMVSIVCALGEERWYVRKPLGGTSKKFGRGVAHDNLLIPASIVKSGK